MTRAWHQHIKKSPRAQRTAPDGEVFDSKQELRDYLELKQRAARGEVRNLKRQVSYPLNLPNCDRAVLTPTGRVARYTADFLYDELNGERYGVLMLGWHEVIHDTKGFMGPVEALRIAIFEAIYNKKVHISGTKRKKSTKIAMRTGRKAKKLPKSVNSAWIKNILKSV